MPKSILARILDDAAVHRASNEKFLAVFDLDSTLFDLTLRISKIVEDFRNDEANKARFPTECEQLKDFVLNPDEWGMDLGLARIGLNGQEHRPFLEALHIFWADCFFSGSHLHHDEPLPGSVEFVQALLKTGAHIMYLTGRDIPRMLEGTVRILRERGFPVDGDNVEVILKPVASMDDARFKADVLKTSVKLYKTIWLFENEPANLNLVAKELPSIGLVFIESCHSGREQLDGVLDRIKHFEVDASEFEHYSK
ncbi:MAG TPA: HAD family hydrolase [Bdellovibrionales bacterium]|nr:HAD family hydrolase [Bdellovibrionales bacterium]